ncbi:MAG: ATP-binding protein, partial [Dongiaceae bacterium]
LELAADGVVTVRDNGRGIPVEPHPKFKPKSALEVILTTLHSGGKFGGKAYTTSGGLHGVGLSLVNALADKLIVETVRDRQLFIQEYSRGKPTSKLKQVGPAANRRGTAVRFHADPNIFGTSAHFQPARCYRMARSKAYLFRGVEIRWRCDPKLIKAEDETPLEAVLHFEGGLVDFLASTLEGRKTVTALPFAGTAEFPEQRGRVEWAIAWPADGDGFCNSYCNTVPTPEGGTHEAGLRSGLARSLNAYGDLVGNRKVAQVTAEDIAGGACMMLSLFIQEPQFQGQTKEKLASVEAQRLTKASIKDHFDHWLTADPGQARDLLDRVVEIAEERLRRREDKELQRKTATRKLRLPGKLT